MKNIILTQFIVLLGGTIFAWFNFFRELASYLRNEACQTGCAVGVVNPIYTPCFYGAIFFLMALILSFIILTASARKG
ncbi:MAG: hypothetical protein HUU49_00060 [Candidatus Buchananbacteria bacterium]|nr:hypothetical protein [Candidatus Buchananbacteria bacterium]